ncbi:MAG: hypothetical protein EA366_10770 [Spirulina sp. DLM2.Bin59]|nr:MAG: hypothetical protein EA366_10770 [Spirulina sp. DLM2.Bin59]
MGMSNSPMANQLALIFRSCLDVGADPAKCRGEDWHTAVAIAPLPMAGSSRIDGIAVTHYSPLIRD